MSDNDQHNGNGHDPQSGEREKIVHFPTLAERDRMRRAQQKAERKAGREPLLNLPPVTKAMVLVFLGIHIAIQLLAGPEQQYWIYEHFGFVPGVYTGYGTFGWYALAGPLTYMVLHGSWVHVLLNSVMMMAFGTGAERWMGGRRMAVFFVLCSLASALIHFALNADSTNPVIGASGGISGLFAAMLLMMQAMGMGGVGRYGIWPFVVLWIGISMIFGFTGGPDGSTVAWAAHIGGFLAGFVFLKPVMRFL